jgi:hypothetical protein
VAASFSLTGSLRLDPRWVDDLNTTLVTDATRVNLSLSLTNGDGDGEADCYWRDVRTVAGGDTDVIDLSALPLSVFGGTGTLEINPNKLRMLYIRNLSDTVTLGPILEDAEQIQVPPGGSLLLSRPADAAFADPNAGVFFVVNTGTSAADYEILLIGVQAT